MLGLCRNLILVSAMFCMLCGSTLAGEVPQKEATLDETMTSIKNILNSWKPIQWETASKIEQNFQATFNYDPSTGICEYVAKSSSGKDTYFQKSSGTINTTAVNIREIYNIIELKGNASTNRSMQYGIMLMTRLPGKNVSQGTGSAVGRTESEQAYITIYTESSEMRQRIKEKFEQAINICEKAQEAEEARQAAADAAIPNTASLAKTMELIKEIMLSTAHITWASGPYSSSLDIVSFECDLSSGACKYVFNTRMKYNGKDSSEWLSTRAFNIREIGHVFIQEQADASAQYLGIRLTSYDHNKFVKFTTQSVSAGKAIGDPKNGDVDFVVINIPDKDTRVKLRKAFHHVIKLCGSLSAPKQKTL